MFCSRLSKVYNKIYKLIGVYGYFMMHNWKFDDGNLVDMYKGLSPFDQIIFNCDIQNLSWDRFLINWCIGIRKYIVKNDFIRTNYAKKKQRILRVIHYIVTPLYLYALWKICTICVFIVSTAFPLFVGH